MTSRTYSLGYTTLTLAFGDLTTSSAEVLVSSDDAYLSMGGGVSAAILRAAGESLLHDAAKRIPARPGDVVVTSAGALPSKHIFHAITIGEGALSPSEVVRQCTRRCLELLQVLDLRSIAFPALGAGTARFDYEDVAVQMIDTMVDTLKGNDRPFQITIYLYDRFRRMEPIDYLAFFERIAVKTAQSAVALRPRRKPARPRRATPRTKEAPRKARIEKLVALDSERQRLEAQLAEHKDALAKGEISRIEKRLHEVQRERIGVLAEVKPSGRPRRFTVFISYSHAYEKMKKKLVKHLRVLDRLGLTSTWHDRMIGVGTEWAGTIDTHLDQAAVILLLISADFIDSTYAYDVEMKRALERHVRREALVVPVILRPVDFEGTPFARLQALPKDARPMNQWPTLDAACVDVVGGLKDAILGLSLRAAKRGGRSQDPMPRSTKRLFAR